jgi:hypothetical protein
MKIVKESLKDKLKGPSEEDVLNQLQGLDPDKAFMRSIINKFFGGVKEFINEVEIETKITALSTLSNLSFRMIDEGNDVFEIFDFIFKNIELKNIEETSAEMQLTLLKATARRGNLDFFKKVYENSELVSEADLKSSLIRAANNENLDIIDYIIKEKLEYIPYWVLKNIAKPQTTNVLKYILSQYKEKIRGKDLSKLKSSGKLQTLK